MTPLERHTLINMLSFPSKNRMKNMFSLFLKTDLVRENIDKDTFIFIRNEFTNFIKEDSSNYFNIDKKIKHIERLYKQELQQDDNN